MHKIAFQAIKISFFNRKVTTLFLRFFERALPLNFFHIRHINIYMGQIQQILHELSKTPKCGAVPFVITLNCPQNSCGSKFLPSKGKKAKESQRCSLVRS